MASKSLSQTLSQRPFEDASLDVSTKDIADRVVVRIPASFNRVCRPSD